MSAGNWRERRDTTKRLQPHLVIVPPEKGYHAVLGFPTPATVRNLHDAEAFIRDMCSDVVKPFSSFDTYNEQLVEAVRTAKAYAEQYNLSMEDFLNQVNALDYQPSVLERLCHRVKHASTQAKLEALVDSMGIAPPIRDVVRSLVGGLKLEDPKKPKKVKRKPGEAKPEPEKPVEELRVQNEVVRNYLVDYFVRAVVDNLKEKKVLERLGYHGFVDDATKVPGRRLRTRIIVSSTAAALLLAAGIAAPTYLRIKAEQAAVRAKEVTSFQESLQIDKTSVASTQYLQKSNTLIEQIVDFRSKYWLAPETTAQFYLCFKKMFQGQPGLPRIDSLAELRPCITEMGTRIPSPVPYLDNFSSLITLVGEKVEELRALEQKVEADYEAQLEKIGAEEKMRGYSMADLRLSVVAARNTFNRGRDQFYQRFALEMSPLEFYALGLTNLEYDRTIGTALPEPSIARLLTEGQELAATLMDDYLAVESADSIKPKPFWQQGGSFDTGTVLVQNLHTKLKGGSP